MTYPKYFKPHQLDIIEKITEQFDSLENGEALMLSFKTEKEAGHARYIVYAWLHQTGQNNSYAIKRASKKTIIITRKKKLASSSVSIKNSNGKSTSSSKKVKSATEKKLEAVFADHIKSCQDPDSAATVARSLFPDDPISVLSLMDLWQDHYMANRKLNLEATDSKATDTEKH